MTAVADLSVSLLDGATGERAEWRAKCRWLDRDVLYIDNAFGDLLSKAPALCEELGNWATSQCVDGFDGVGDMYSDPDHRTSASCPLTYNGGDQPHPKIERIGKMLQGIEGRFVLEYLRGNEWATVGQGDFGGSSGFELLRYRAGEFFKRHVDVSPSHPVLSRRRLSAVACANDNYEGGELYFPRQDITVPKAAGSLVIFPSGFTHPHESLPVVSGVKYSAVTWYF